MLYVRDNIPSRLKIQESFEGMFVELNFKKQKWLLSCSYNPHVQGVNNHLDMLQN